MLQSTAHFFCGDPSYPLPSDIEESHHFVLKCFLPIEKLLYSTEYDAFFQTVCLKIAMDQIVFGKWFYHNYGFSV